MANIFKKAKDAVTKAVKKDDKPSEAQKPDTQAEALKQDSDAPIVARKVPAGPRKTYADLMAEAHERAKANKERIEAIKKQRDGKE